jgi:hypothetical protein
MQKLPDGLSALITHSLYETVLYSLDLRRRTPNAKTLDAIKLAMVMYFHSTSIYLTTLCRTTNVTFTKAPFQAQIMTRASTNTLFFVWYAKKVKQGRFAFESAESGWQRSLATTRQSAPFSLSYLVGADI